MSKKSRILIRNIYGESYLESFLVFAVGSILAIRLFLILTGYPQIGGSKLHIAHMLWGGLLMMVAVLLMMSYLNRRMVRLAVILAGIGFGTFIDEVGKFITQDNDYFYQPAFAIMYAIFILTYMIVEYLINRKDFSPKEYEANAIRTMVELSGGTFTVHDRELVLAHLERSSETWARDLSKIVRAIDVGAGSDVGLYPRVTLRLNRFYRSLATSYWFESMLIAILGGELATKIIYVVHSIFTRTGFGFEYYSTIDWLILISSLGSTVFVGAGVWMLRKSRLAAYQQFARSLLVSVLITRVFLFYDQQLGAFGGFVVELLMLLALQYMIERESKVTTSDSGSEVGTA